MLFSHQLCTVVSFAVAFCTIQVLADMIHAHKVHYLFGSHPSFGSSSLLPDYRPQAVLEERSRGSWLLVLLNKDWFTAKWLSTLHTCNSSLPIFPMNSVTGEIHGRTLEVNFYVMAWANLRIQCNAPTMEALLSPHCQLPSQPQASLVFLWSCSGLSHLIKLTENQPCSQTQNKTKQKR